MFYVNSFFLDPLPNNIMYIYELTGADPGFPVGGGADPPGGR